MSESLSTIIARIIAVMDASGTPIADFVDSVKPGDLDDLCTDLGITLAQAQAAQRALLAAE